eukprot:CAMPEP_0170496610 /NCGR_PEP_ID=MMETSP0208-20121228/22263_1 /TAXON_ID=197538 /ORGANISM="Strombidium inclinatum, Strain S3" /LENGTH=132 /DNA_ID=CAMNT_0010773209 /DNA_START=521 /DNA_END=916 /DNA_ORIENTATION=+
MFMQAMNTVHHPRGLNGDLIMGLAMITLVANSRTSVLFLEDMIFMDVNSVSWGVFTSFWNKYIIGVPLMYYLQQHLLGHALSLDYFTNLKWMRKSLVFVNLEGYEALNYKDFSHLWAFTIVAASFAIWDLYG